MNDAGRYPRRLDELADPRPAIPAVADALARHNHPEAIGRVAAGRIDAVAGADSRHDQRIDPQRREQLVEVGPLEGRGVALAEDFFVGPAPQPRVELK